MGSLFVGCACSIRILSIVSDSLEVRRAGPEVRDAQARLFGRCFAKPAHVEALRWRYDRNPHGQAVSLILADDDGHAACSFAYVPRLAVSRTIDGKVTEGYIGQQGDVMTDPDWQRKGLARRLVQECAKATGDAGFLFNWGFPNRQSAPVFLKLEWLSSGAIRPRRHLLTSDGKSKKRRLADGRVAALRLPWDVMRCARARRALGDLPVGYSTRVLESFPEAVGGLSRAVEARYPFMLHRDAEWLNWRFLETPSRGHVALGLYDPENTFVGYVVIQPPRAELDSGVGYLVDFLVPDAGLEDALLHRAIDALEARGASVVESWSVDGSWWRGKLERAGFLAAKPENHLFVYHFPLAPEHPFAEAALDASTWYLTDGDRDDELMG